MSRRRSRTSCARSAPSLRRRSSSPTRSSPIPGSTSGPPPRRASAPSGRRRETGSTGSSPGTSSTPGTCRTRSGTSAASSTSASTASTGTSRPGSASGSPTTGRASRATRARSPTRSSSTRSASFTNALRGLGVKKGDRVAIYMPMIPELPVAMLACTRIGAAHSVVFGGFSADALADRIDDAECTVVITADGGYRKGATVALKNSADEAIRRTSSVKHCVVVKRTGDEVAWTDGRDHWYHDLIEGQSTTADPEPMDSEDLLYLLYTSGTTAKPKGIMHTTGGYLAGVVGHPSVHLRHPRRHRRVLVHGRHRLGDRPLVHRLRPAGERDDRGHLRGRDRLPRQGPMGPDRGEVPGDDPLHRADRHPRADEVRPRAVRR